MKIIEYQKAFLALCLAVSLAAAQTADDIGKIALSVVLPDQMSEVDGSLRGMLENKVKQIVTGAGLSATGLEHRFIIYPKFIIFQTDVIEGGLQNVTKVTAELSLFIKQSDNDLLFATTNRQLIGTGRTKIDAVRNAISKIPARDAEFSKFLEEGRKKIIAYYEAKCGDIIAKADGLVRRQEYEEAIFQLLTVPEEAAGCYAKITQRVVSAFNAHQTAVCERQMQEARMFLAAGDFESTLNILAGIDPAFDCFLDARTMLVSVINQQCDRQLQLARSRVAAGDFEGALTVLGSVNPAANCYEDALILLASAGGRIAEEKRRDWDLKMQLYNDQKAREQRDFEAAQKQISDRNELEAQAIRAARDIGVERAKNQPQSVNYNIRW